VSGWSAFKCCKVKQLGPFFYFILLLALSMLGVTGFKGGELVYRYGVGVKTTLFSTEDHGLRATGHAELRQNIKPGSMLQVERPAQADPGHSTHTH
jgi:hypothetical protein